MVDFIVFDLKLWYSNIYSCFNTCFPTKYSKNKEPILIIFEEPDIYINNDIQIYHDDWYINWNESDNF